MRLLLSRHGQATWNLQGRYQGQGDPPLAPEGERQARALASRLALERIDAVYASDLQRAARTAEIVAEGRGLAVVRDAAWRETSYGEWTGLTGEEIAARDPAHWERWRADWNTAPPGGETGEDVQRRVVAAAQSLRQRQPNDTVLIVTHAGPLLVLQCWVAGLPLGSTDALPSAHGGLSCVRWDDGGPRAEFWNDVSHLAAPSAVALRPPGAPWPGPSGSGT